MTASAAGTLRPVHVDDPARDVAWMVDAACAGSDSETFFPTGTTGPALSQEAEAKRICSGCPVARTCLAWSLRMRLDHGVFGGLNETERREVSRHYSRERATAPVHAGGAS